MLKGISHLFSPELLATLYRMGHGDEIVLADAHFPGESLNPHVIRADGLPINQLLEAILPLFALDTYVEDPVLMMSTVSGDNADPSVPATYREILSRLSPETGAIKFIERFSFYARIRSAFAVVMSGDTHKYANIILKKKVTPV
jgi:L-fucose mutarotase